MKLGPRLERCNRGIEVSLPVTVSSVVGIDHLRALCLVEVGQSPPMHHIAWIPSSSGPTISALLNLSWKQIDALAACDYVTRIELAL